MWAQEETISAQVHNPAAWQAHLMSCFLKCREHIRKSQSLVSGVRVLKYFLSHHTNQPFLVSTAAQSVFSSHEKKNSLFPLY